MDILILSLICAAGYLILLSKMFGMTNVLRHHIFFDVILTVGLPFLFLGTFSGMATAFLAGVLFSIATAFLRLCYGKRVA